MTVRGAVGRPQRLARRGVAIATFAAVVLMCSACATSKIVEPTDARGRLLAAAAVEGASDRSATNSERRSLEPPANLAGIDLSPRSADDPRAWCSLSEAIESADEAHPQIRTPPSVVASGLGEEGDADEALRAYLRGRSAMLAGDFPQAVGEFERAHLLDPGEASILRQLGRAYSQAGNGPRAAEAFSRLRGLEPDDAEALFTIGMNAANRGRHAEAVAALSRLREIFAEGDGDANLSTVVAVDFALADALLELGHDRAFLEMAELALAHPVETLAARGDDPRVGEIYRRRSEIAQAMGDATLRLGDPDAAVEHYRSAAALPVADPAALRSRLVHGLLVAGLPLAAQAELLAACEGGAAGDAEVALAGHLLDAEVDVTPLVAAVEQLGRERPDESEIVRVLARLDPDATVRILTDLAAQSADADGVEQLLDWVERVDLGSACSLAVDLARRNPDAIAPSAARLAASSGTPRELREHLAALPPSPARTALEASLLVALRDPAAAWTILDAVSPETRFDPAILRARAIAAGALGDATLVAEVEADVRGAVAADRLDEGAAIDAEWAVIEAMLAANAPEMAWRRLEATPIDPTWPASQRSAWLLLQSRAAALESRVAVGAEAELLAAVAVRSADAAVEADLRSTEAWEWRLSLRDPRSGLAPDAEAHRRDLEAMQSALAGTSIVERLRAEQDLMRGRVDAALARLEGVLEAHPGDAAVLQALVSSLNRAGRNAEIPPRLDRRLAEAPADPVGWDIRVATLVQAGRAAEAERELRALLESDPDHPFAKGLLEAMLRATGRGVEAEALAAERLDRRPATPGQAIDKAMLLLERSGRLAAAARDEAAAAEVVANSTQAVDAAAALVESVSAMSRAERMRLISIPLQASPDVRSRRETMATLAEAVLAADAEAPLAVHGAVLLAAALEDPLDRDRTRFAELVARAVRSPAARAVDVAAAIRWLGIAERMLQAGEPATAAEVILEASLRLPWPEGEARRTLRAATVALFARAGGRADESLEFVEALREGQAFANGEGLMPAEEQGDVANPLLDASSIHSIVGDRAGAETLLEAVLAENPDDAMALNNLAYARLEDGFLDEETRGMLERAFELRPSDAHILDSLGWLRYREGVLEDDEQGGLGAVSLLGEAVRLGGVNPSLEGLDHLGDALWRVGRREEAMEAWRSAVEIGLRRFEREGTIRGIEGFQRGAFGMVVRDPEAFYEESYGEPIARVRAKLRAVRDGQPPEIADSEAADTD